MFVVGLQRDVEYLCAVGGVVQASEEVCVIADVERQVIPDIFEGNQTYFLKLLVLFENVGMRGRGEKYVLDVLSHNVVNGLAEGGEGVQGGFTEDALEGPDDGERREAIVRCESRKVKGAIANRGRDTWFAGGNGADDAERDVSEGEVGASWDRRP